MGIKKPLIRQAGSAEAFAGSATTGREHHYNTIFIGTFNPIVEGVSLGFPVMGVKLLKQKGC